MPEHSISSPALTEIINLGIFHRVIRHPAGVQSAADLAREIGVSLQQIPKTLLLRHDRDKYLVCILPSDKKADMAALANAIGADKISMAAREELVSVTGYEFGTLSPFGLPRSLELFMENSLLEVPEVYLGCGVHGYDVVIKVADLVKTLQPQLMPIAK